MLGAKSREGDVPQSSTPSNYREPLDCGVVPVIAGGLGFASLLESLHSSRRKRL
jgi:hypothetical protein